MFLGRVEEFFSHIARASKYFAFTVWLIAGLLTRITPLPVLRDNACFGRVTRRDKVSAEAIFAKRFLLVTQLIKISSLASARGNCRHNSRELSTTHGADSNNAIKT